MMFPVTPPSTYSSPSITRKGNAPGMPRGGQQDVVQPLDVLPDARSRPGVPRRQVEDARGAVIHVRRVHRQHAAVAPAFGDGARRRASSAARTSRSRPGTSANERCSGGSTRIPRRLTQSCLGLRYRVTMRSIDSSSPRNAKGAISAAGAHAGHDVEFGPGQRVLGRDAAPPLEEPRTEPAPIPPPPEMIRTSMTGGSGRSPARCRAFPSWSDQAIHNTPRVGHQASHRNWSAGQAVAAGVSWGLWLAAHPRLRYGAQHRRHPAEHGLLGDRVPIIHGGTLVRGLVAGGTDGRPVSSGKITFQSFFMSTTVQPFASAASSSALSSLPMCDVAVVGELALGVGVVDDQRRSAARRRPSCTAASGGRRRSCRTP